MEVALGREVTTDELRDFETVSWPHASETQLLRYIRAAMEERSITDVRAAMRDSWQPFTAEKYVEEQRRFGGDV